MADGLVQVAPDSTGAKIDNTSLTVGANTVMRQRTNIAGQAAAEVADVRNAAPGAADYGLVARIVGAFTPAGRNRSVVPVDAIAKLLRLTFSGTTGVATVKTVTFNVTDTATQNEAARAKWAAITIAQGASGQTIYFLGLKTISTLGGATFGTGYETVIRSSTAGPTMVGTGIGNGERFIVPIEHAADRYDLRLLWASAPTDVELDITIDLYDDYPLAPVGQRVARYQKTWSALDDYQEFYVPPPGFDLWIYPNATGTATIVVEYAWDTVSGPIYTAAYLRHPSLPGTLYTTLPSTPVGPYQIIFPAGAVKVRIRCSVAGSGWGVLWGVSVSKDVSDYAMDLPNNTGSLYARRVLGSRANASAPSWGDGNYVPLSVDTAGNLRTVGTVSPVAATVWDVSDRAGRLVGLVGPAAASLWDVSDRSARLVGLVGPAAASLWDVSDRSARLLGRSQLVGAGAAELADVRKARPGYLDYGLVARTINEQVQIFHEQSDPFDPNPETAGGYRNKERWASPYINLSGTVAWNSLRIDVETGTTASAVAVLQSIPRFSFGDASASPVRFRFRIASVGAQAGSGWQVGVFYPPSNTLNGGAVGSPISVGAAFLLHTDGTYRVRYFTNTGSMAFDQAISSLAAADVLEIVWSHERMEWLVDGVSVATFDPNGAQAVNVPITISAYNGAAATATVGVLVRSVSVIADGPSVSGPFARPEIHQRALVVANHPLSNHGPASGIPPRWSARPGSPVLWDPIDSVTIDATMWTTAVSGAGSSVSTNVAVRHAMALTSGAVATAFGELKSVSYFYPRGSAPMGFHFLVEIPSRPAGVGYIWGVGSDFGWAQNTARGAFFVFDETGAFFACTRGSSNSRQFLIPNVPSSTVNEQMSTEIVFSEDRIEFFVNGVSVAVANITSDTSLGTKYFKPYYGARAYSTGNVAGTFYIYQPSVVDYSRSNVSLSDPTYPVRQAAVSAAGALSVDVNDRAGRLVGLVGPATASVWSVQGDVARDVANSGNPLQGGGVSSLPWTLPTAVSADGRRVGQWLDRRGRTIVGPQKIPTYASAIRAINTTVGKRSLATGALTANTNKQIATIYHTAASTKRGRLLYVAVTILELATAAGYIEFEVQRLSATTAPATGNPTITPLAFDSGDAVSECTVLALPTTQGSYAAVNEAFGHNIVNLGITSVTGPTTVPPQYPIRLVLFDARSGMDENKDAVLRAGIAEGFAVIVRSTGAGSVLFIAEMQHTEEP